MFNCRSARDRKRLQMSVVQRKSTKWVIRCSLGRRKSLCPDAAYKSLFYHLGFMDSDTPLLLHGAQDTFLHLLLAPKADPNAASIAVPADWDQTLAV
jgi:hypothetical protein